MITLQNRHLTVRIDERLGAEITQVVSGDRELLAYYEWDTPVRVGMSASYEKHRHDWLSEYRGGWQFLFPNAGPECEVDGVNLPFHGEWSRTRVEVVEQTATSLRVRAGSRLPILVEREIRLLEGPDRVVVTTRVQNESDEDTSFIWGEHPAFRVDPDDRVDLPHGEVVDAAGTALGVWPVVDGNRRLDVVDDERQIESVHFVTKLAAGWAALRRRDIGVAMAWEPVDFPNIWLWRERGSRGFPFYGRASLLAIEPAATWPGIGLAEARKRGQAIPLSAGETRTTTMILTTFVPTRSPVVSVSLDGIVTLGE